ncbi:hypothetical protein NQ315_003745 [Exocentrus adspersus]|uniref:beta-fructofuranosidase n=1 Tax=Exocentrus adspersus TaxID=1586481 RepID=A0AAV8VIV3_9CUCU|nr:hypothetical protein NQ315_003745 [Exocentrus adspersus]
MPLLARKIMNTSITTISGANMEGLVREMQDTEHGGVPVRSQKLFLTSIPAAFMGYDLIEWLMERLGIEESEALNIANQLCQFGYFFPISDSKNLVVKDDSSLYRFQSPYYWPWQNRPPDNVEYAIYLAKRTLRNKQRHGLEDYELETLSNLKKNLANKWDFITSQAEEQVKLSKGLKKADKLISDSQERAYWRVHRPPPGMVSSLEPCPVPTRSWNGCRTRKRTIEDCRREVELLRNSLSRTRVKVSQALESMVQHVEIYMEYDPLITPTQPSNPWVSEDLAYWQLNSPLKFVIPVPDHRILDPPYTMIFKVLTIFHAILLVHIHKSNCDVDPNLTVENANKYIAENKNSVNQTYRLKYHAMAPIGWINDPNGFIFYQNEYHLFYQYNPYATTPNKMHWGHLKSKDLVHWEDLPVALAPDRDYDSDGVFSGSAIEKDGKLYVMYTGNSGNRQVQCIAVSEDGVNFTKIEQNPVLKTEDLPSNAKPEDFRDPKVFKRDDLYYVVTVSKTINETGQVLLYQSKDLIDWEFKSILLEGNKSEGIMWECPDLFELDGKDVLLLSSIQVPRSGNDHYNIDSVIAFVGEVDWEQGKFKVESMKELDHGMDFYATQTTTDDKNRRVMIAWMNMWGRTEPTTQLNNGWVGAMTLPRELRIVDGALVQAPIVEISGVYQTVAEYNDVTLTDETSRFNGVAGKVGELELEADLKQCEIVTIELRRNGDEKTILTYNTDNEELTLDRSNSGINITGEENPQVFSRNVKVPLNGNVLKLQVFLDVSSVEVLVNDGKESLTATIFPTKTSSDLIRFVTVGTAVFKRLVFSNIVLQTSNMVNLRTLTILHVIMIHIHKSYCDVDPNLTVENANEYIAKNKNTVDQTYRLKYHAMAPIGWINDPNGFIFYQNEYHLFYQYNPYDTKPNKIHWGHLKSKDLVRWEDLPVALAPDHDYDSDGVFSGSAIEKDGKLYVMYTGNSGNRQVQCVAVSEDGVNFTKIEQNPVLKTEDLPSNAKPEDFRDPKVFKRDDLYYVVTVSKTINETGQVLLYQSKDLIDWEFKSILLEGNKSEGIMWECPDLFELDGKDVLLLSSIQVPRSGNDYYNIDSVIAFVGEVDWEQGKFKVESMKELDHGMDFLRHSNNH